MTKVFVYVEGGVIQTIATDGPIDLIVLDGDVGAEFHDGDIDLVDLHGNKFQARVAFSKSDIGGKKVVDHYFKQVRK